jgi:two-component system C4-dicarboxylate transport sensor histidine kinase DctB
VALHDPSLAPTESDLGVAHTRFARAVMSIYLATAAVAVALFASTLFTDLAHERDSARDTLSLETQVRAHYLGRHLQLLAEELTRLGLRSEVDLLDENMEPERSLLRLSHEKSTFFNVGVAILGADGTLLWSEPQTFQGAGAAELLLKGLKNTHAVQIVPGRGQGGGSSILYVASPILRYGQFTGALLGAIDLASGGALESREGGGSGVLVALSTRDGTLVYPPRSHAFADDPEWRRLVRSIPPFAEEVSLAGRGMVVAGAPVQGTEFTLLSLVAAADLFGPARSRLVTRLVLGLTLAALPLLALVVLLRRSLRLFRTSEEDAVRNERLRALGEAVDAIAHEVKNSLNGLRVGLDLILRGERAGIEARHRQAVAGLRTEIERLSNFTTELLSFSKGLVPRPVALDLVEFVRKVSDLSRSRAESLAVRLEICASEEPVRVKADPALVHVAVASLLGNALDALGASVLPAPCVLVQVGAYGVCAGVRVADNGPGVSDTVKRRLFEPFVSGKPNGVGIGLALSRKIARAHGGDLVLEGSERGAVFYMTLPLESG